jgi:hypothetical protein
MNTVEAQGIILSEYLRAVTKFSEFNTPPDNEALKREAIQVGAMALRFIIDCC